MNTTTQMRFQPRRPNLQSGNKFKIFPQHTRTWQQITSIKSNISQKLGEFFVKDIEEASLGKNKSQNNCLFVSAKSRC